MINLPPNAPDNFACVLDGYEKWLIATTFRDTWNACLAEVQRLNSTAQPVDITLPDSLSFTSQGMEVDPGGDYISKQEVVDMLKSIGFQVKS